MKPVSEMTTREKTDILIRLMKWHYYSGVGWFDGDGYAILDDDGDTLNLYVSYNMYAAWLVLNWWQSLKGGTPLYYGDFQNWFSLAPKKAQAKWLDTILELALKDPELTKKHGMVKDD